MKANVSLSRSSCNDLKNLVSGPPVNTSLQDLQGGEFYYNAEINPWLHLTGDMQVIQPAFASRDTAIVLGARAKVNF